MVYGTLAFQGLVLFGLVLFAVANNFPQGTVLLFGILFAVYVLCLFCVRHKINLTASLIEQAVAVIIAHPQLLFAAALLIFMGAVVYAVCMGGAFLLISSGEWTYVTTATAEPTSVTSLPCNWTISSSSYLGLLLLSFAALWSVEVFKALRFYVISLTTGMWYFKSAGLSAHDGSSHSEHVRNPVTTALTFAFTKSFGSICFAALIMYIVQRLREMARRSARNNGVLGCLIACCIQCIIAYIEFLTRFALTFHALTGDDFCTSARTFTSHLNRHGFSALWVNWIAQGVFSFGSFVLSLLVSAICIGIMYHTLPADVDDPIMALVVLGILSFIIALVFLSFVGGILLNVIDACYSCLVLDLDHGAQHQPEVAQCIIMVANPTYVVQQPGGDLAITHAQAQPTVAVAYAQPTAAVAYGQPTHATAGVYGQPTHAIAGVPTAYAQPPTAYARPIVNQYQGP